jgi:hypothetical protein
MNTMNTMNTMNNMNNMNNMNTMNTVDTIKSIIYTTNIYHSFTTIALWWSVWSLLSYLTKALVSKYKRPDYVIYIYICMITLCAFILINYNFN